MNAMSARLVVFAQDRWDRLVALWRARDERGLSTVEMAVLAVGLVLAASILVAAIIAVVRSLSGQLKTKAGP